MMNNSTFNQSIDCALKINARLRNKGNLVDQYIDDRYGIKDLVYISSCYRRAHVSIIDARETKKLWLLHFTIFPNINDPSPIYGFDVIAGPTRVSGAFHDFSAGGDTAHPMMQWFSNRTQGLEWNKARTLPEWAQKIFSPNIVAIGAVGPEELTNFIDLGLETLDYYLDNVGQNTEHDYSSKHNEYCYYQRQNPHTPRVLVNLGFSEQQAKDFVENNLFPKIA
jgi:hypothetical protein